MGKTKNSRKRNMSSNDSRRNSMRIQAKQNKKETEKSNEREWILEWDEYFMALAFLSAQRSKDPSKQVGACIVNEDKRIVGMGYNGMPNGCKDEDFTWGKGETADDNKHLYVCHAELNAVVNKIQADIRGCSMYVTLFPCNECAKIIVQSGLKNVTYYEKSKKPENKAKAQKKEEIMKATEKMFSYVKIDLKKYDKKAERKTVFKIGPKDSIIL